MDESAKEQEMVSQVNAALFPSCNSKSERKKDEKTGRSVMEVKFWCTPESGGVRREWSGVPRKMGIFALNNFEIVKSA